MAYSRELTRLNGEYTEARHKIETSFFAGPPVLVIALKRFKETPNGRRTKITTLVDFPVEGLDLRPYVKVPVSDAFGPDNGFAPFAPVEIDLADLEPTEDEDEAGSDTDDDDDSDGDGDGGGKEGGSATAEGSGEKSVGLRENDEGDDQKHYSPFFGFWRRSKKTRKKRKKPKKEQEKDAAADADVDADLDAGAAFEKKEKKEEEKKKRRSAAAGSKARLPALPRLPRGSPLYDLTAIVNHHGTLDGGHYTAFAKDKGRWFKFNDSNVHEVDAARQLVTKDA